MNPNQTERTKQVTSLGVALSHVLGRGLLAGRALERTCHLWSPPALLMGLWRPFYLGNVLAKYISLAGFSTLIKIGQLNKPRCICLLCSV